MVAGSYASTMTDFEELGPEAQADWVRRERRYQRAKDRWGWVRHLNMLGPRLWGDRVAKRLIPEPPNPRPQHRRYG